MKKSTHAEVQSRVDKAHGKNNNIELLRIPYKRGNDKNTKERIYNILYNKLIPS